MSKNNSEEKDIKLVTENKVIEIVKNALENKNIRIANDSRLIEDLSLDSMAIVMIMNDLEDEFHIRIEDDAFDSITTVQEIINLVILQLSLLVNQNSGHQAAGQSTSHSSE